VRGGRSARPRPAAPRPCRSCPPGRSRRVRRADLRGPALRASRCTALSSCWPILAMSAACTRKWWAAVLRLPTSSELGAGGGAPRLSSHPCSSSCMAALTPWLMHGAIKRNRSSTSRRTRASKSAAAGTAGAAAAARAQRSSPSSSTMRAKAAASLPSAACLAAARRARRAGHSERASMPRSCSAASGAAWQPTVAISPSESQLQSARRARPRQD